MDVFRSLGQCQNSRCQNAGSGRQELLPEGAVYKRVLGRKFEGEHVHSHMLLGVVSTHKLIANIRQYTTTSNLKAAYCHSHAVRVLPVVEPSTAIQAASTAPLPMCHALYPTVDVKLEQRMQCVKIYRSYRFKRFAAFCSVVLVFAAEVCHGTR